MLTLGKKDKAVLRAFADRRAAEGHKLATDGTRLDGLWLGGTGIAEWAGGQVVLHDLGSRAAQTVQRALKKMIPARHFNPGGTASWVIREKGTGKVVMETFNPKAVARLNTAKYEAVPIHEHLASLNRATREGR